MVKLIFLGGLFPNESRREIESKSTGVIQYAADALQWAIVTGLDNYYSQNFKLVNLPYIGSFPKRYSDLKTKTFKFSHIKGANDINVGFINLPIYKLYSRFYQAKKTLKKVIDNDNTIIIIYAIHTPFIKAAIDIKKNNPSVKICLIVPDLPEFMDDDKSFIRKYLKNIEKGLLNKYLKEIDSFVVLSDYMHLPLQINNRPWVRVEGIFEQKTDNIVLEKEPFKTILYTGTLAKRYGILNLLEAFSLIKNNDYRLWICGDGDAKEELELMAKEDSRIKYFGQLSREEVIKLQKKATVLVNPRISEGEFTKYSFPSKTMEYLASGTPCVLYRLQGIPEEYFDYCYMSEEETPLGLYKTIISVCEKEQSELNEFGEKAKRFILENKNPEIQCKKIYNMLSKFELNENTK
ncbi:glycosyltransferase family 4 protein [Flavobacterium sp. ASV13]|uniref:glycosyltransferase family 4 protein n=1 Tax=Flavobacterium sp. ASV13 TaxID=1506583 RepID=UPI0005592BF4|nr:glycosyltransferase [Flavobacterium sp. ASV13]